MVRGSADRRSRRSRPERSPPRRSFSRTCSGRSRSTSTAGRATSVRDASSPPTSRKMEPLHYFNTVEFPTFDLRSELRTIAAPTLVVVGDDDMIGGPVTRKRCARAAERPARHDPRIRPLRLRRAARRVPRRPDRFPPVSEQAVAALRAGRAVILPTDTVYGLCALPAHEDVLFDLKGRDRSKPVALLAADIDALVAAEPGLDRSVLERYLPGPYTLIFGTVGVRVPHLPPAAADVMREVGVVAATSANLSGGSGPAACRGHPRGDPCRVRGDRRRGRAARRAVHGDRPHGRRAACPPAGRRPAAPHAVVASCAWPRHRRRSRS